MVHPAASGYSSAVEHYVAGRPKYPRAILSVLPPAKIIIELGAGTGNFTELLASSGKRIVAIEPSGNMAACLAARDLPGVEVITGSAEAIPAPDAIADLVCCATSFHWFDYNQATSEIFRVLVRDGSLALVWNMRDNSVSWVAELSRVLERHAADTPRQSAGKWRIIFEDNRFEHLTTRRYRTAQVLPSSGIVARALSTSFIARLPKATQQTVRSEVEQIIAQTPLLREKDTVAFPYITEFHLFRKNITDPIFRTPG